ncbi:hypothetical protein EDB84DRAFT_1590753 [Lactarius hengduanensis]|nr:hypothetical protein EDB84DRAFT_1590753 [Lactarius hengduanensis]
MVILGTEYAGEMKKGVFSVMHYLQPVKFGQLSLHSSANVGIDKGDVTLFFGLSGTGKTTLSADPRRGCYQRLSTSPQQRSPRFSMPSLWQYPENVVYSPTTRAPDYDDISITENTRARIRLSLSQCTHTLTVNRQPSNIIMLTCDAFGVLPPLANCRPSSKLPLLAGYTSRCVLEPIPTFSTCYSAPFIVLPPGRYAEMLADRMSKNQVDCWLINTGWTGGRYGTGKRCPLAVTRRIVDAVHSGELKNAQYETFETFGLQIPTAIEGVPRELLNPALAWPDRAAFEREVRKLGGMFQKAFALYEKDVEEKVRLAGPQL